MPYTTQQHPCKLNSITSIIDRPKSLQVLVTTTILSRFLVPTRLMLRHFGVLVVQEPTHGKATRLRPHRESHPPGSPIVHIAHHMLRLCFQTSRIQIHLFWGGVCLEWRLRKGMLQTSTKRAHIPTPRMWRVVGVAARPRFGACTSLQASTAQVTGQTPAPTATTTSSHRSQPRHQDTEFCRWNQQAMLPPVMATFVQKDLGRQGLNPTIGIAKADEVVQKYESTSSCQVFRLSLIHSSRELFDFGLGPSHQVQGP